MDQINTECKNNYTKENFDQYYGESEQELRNCAGCPYMDYDSSDGTMTCKKFM